MKDLPYTEKDGHIVIEMPATLDQNDWLGMRDLVHRQFVDQGMTRLIIDCESNLELPSIAFGTFTSLSRDLHRSGGSLTLVHVSEKIRQVLIKTRLDNLIPMHGNLTEVIRKSTPTKPSDPQS